MNDVELIERCIELARDAAARGNGPFGAIVVCGDEIVAEAQNQVDTELDPSSHAEVVAIRLACQKLGRVRLEDCTLYTSCEPCWGCSSTIRVAGIPRVVFAAHSVNGTGGCYSAYPILTSDALPRWFGPAPEVVPDLLRERAEALWEELGWPKGRNLSEQAVDDAGVPKPGITSTPVVGQTHAPLQQTPLRRLAFIGLGEMGTPMAANLIRAGNRVSVFDIVESKASALAPLGAKAAKSPRQCIEDAEIVFTSLQQDATHAVYLGDADHPGGLLEEVQPEQTIVDLGSTSYPLTLHLSRSAQSRGVAFIDAPVTGGGDGAARGTLAIMAGGDREVFERVAPLLHLLGKTVRHVGAPGSGQAMRLVNQLLMVIHHGASLEAFALARSAGIEAKVLIDVLGNSLGGSSMFEHNLPRFISGDFSSARGMAWLLRDEEWAAEAATRLGIDTPLMGAARAYLARAVEMGYGDEDIAACIKLFGDAAQG